MKRLITILLLFASFGGYSQVPNHFKNNYIATDTLLLKKTKQSLSDTVLSISNDTVSWRIINNNSSITGDSLFYYNGAWYNKYDTLYVSGGSSDSLYFKYGTTNSSSGWYGLNDTVKIKNNYLTTVDSSVFATKSYTLNNFKGSADSSLPSGYGSRHWVASNFAPITSISPFSKTGKIIYPTISTSKLMIGSTTMADTTGCGLHVVDGCITAKGTTGTLPTVLAGANTKFAWIPSQGALLAGTYTGTEANTIGNYAYNLANRGSATGAGSVCIGGLFPRSTGAYSGNYNSYDCQATNTLSTVIGSQSCIASGGKDIIISSDGCTNSGNLSSVFSGNSITSTSNNSVSAGIGLTVNHYNSLVFGKYNVAPGASVSAEASYLTEFVIGNGTGTGTNSNNALVVRRRGFLGLNCGDTSAFPRSQIQANVKSNKYTNREMFNFVDNNKNNKINTYAQSIDTSSCYGAFTATGKFQMYVKDQTGATTFQVDSTGEISHKLTHYFASVEDTTVNISLAQNTYSKLPLLITKDNVNFTKAGDSITTTKAGSYWITSTWSFQGDNAKDWTIAIFENGVFLKSITRTTTGTTNYQGGALNFYCNNCAVGSVFSFRVACKSTGTNAIAMKGCTVFIERKY